MLEIKNLALSYDEKNRILDGIDFTLHPQEIVIVGGKTGSGKSTLARCISGFIQPETVHSLSGSICVDGEDILTADISRIARNIALVQQDVESQICTLNVVDEVAFGPENFQIDSSEIESLITSSLQSVDAHHLRNRSTYALSGGEKQRVVIASMLAGRPDYLVLDEPTSSLDPKGVQQLKALLLRLRDEGMGILCIEHNITQMASIADRLLKLQTGKLTATPPSEIQAPLIAYLRPHSSTSFEPLLRANGISYSYGRKRAVDNVTLEFSRGEIVALMGDNGSGKSTLLALLSGLLSPDGGTIFLQGTLINEMSRVHIARSMGVVFQNPNHQIFERTVWRDQILGVSLLELDPDEYLEGARRLLIESGLGDRLEQNPFSLSYGQKRRLNITSTCFHSPDLLLLDEPFIGQDSEGIEFIAQQLLKAQEVGGTTIISTHDPWFVSRYCTRLIFLKEGSILVDGPPRVIQSWLRENGEPLYATSGVGLE
ncbi:MAG: ABC transporter ATP-binding protein [Candidatus Thorarchaeota archaeon]